MTKCMFDEKGFCSAVVCYSIERCDAKDEKGNPFYGPIYGPLEAKHRAKSNKRIEQTLRSAAHPER